MKTRLAQVVCIACADLLYEGRINHTTTEDDRIRQRDERARLQASGRSDRFLVIAGASGQDTGEFDDRRAASDRRNNVNNVAQLRRGYRCRIEVVELCPVRNNGAGWARED